MKAGPLISPRPSKENTDQVEHESEIGKTSRCESCLDGSFSPIRPCVQCRTSIPTREFRPLLCWPFLAFITLPVDFLSMAVLVWESSWLYMICKLFSTHRRDGNVGSSSRRAHSMSERREGRGRREGEKGISTRCGNRKAIPTRQRPVLDFFCLVRGAVRQVLFCCRTYLRC